MPFTLVLAFVLTSFAQQLPDASTLLKRQTERLQKYRSLQYVSESAIEISQEGRPPIKTTTETSVYRVNPGKSRVEPKVQGISAGMTIVSDGEFTWMYNPSTKQYTKTAAALGLAGILASSSGLPDLSDFSKTLTNNAKTLREETIEVDGKARPCWVIEIRIDKVPLPTAQNSALSEGVMSFWMDKEVGINLRTAISFKVQVAAANTPVQTTVRTEIKTLKIDEPLADSLFTFIPPPDAKEVATFSASNLGRADLSGTNAPVFDVKTLDGVAYGLSSLKGKTVLLDFWTTWCAPCRQAMPALEVMNREFKDQGLVILGIDAGEDRKTVDAFLKTTPASYPTALGIDSDILTAFQVTAYPTYVLIDSAGKIVAHQIGFAGEGSLRGMLAKAGFAARPVIVQNPPAPLPADVLRVGAGVSPPSVLSRVEPQYSDAARAARLQGTVVLQAVISEEGIPSVIRVVRSLGLGLDENAVAAIEQWRFRPGMKDGNPVKVSLNIEVNFNLRDGPPANSASPSFQLIKLISAADPIDSSLPAPTLVSPPEGAVFDIYPRMTTVQWNASTGAVSYLVQQDYSSGGVWQSDRDPRSSPAYVANGTEFTFAFVGAQPGRWRVWPVNAAGQRGTPSEWRTFSYTR